MIKIITDTASDYDRELAKEKGIIILSMSIQFGEEAYYDGIDISKKEFYDKLIESDTLPKTSQIPPHVFEECYKQVVADGDTAVVVVMSSELSGTCQSAMLAAADYEGKIYVVDSLSATIGEECLIDYALQLRDDGMNAKEISEELDRCKKDVTILALLDTLEYLKKGGRISATTAFVGGVLSIKPVVTVADGKVVMLGKARGSKNGNNMLRELVVKVGGVDYSKPIYLGYSGLHDGMLRKYVEDSAELLAPAGRELPVTQIGSTIGTHVGPGAIAVCFFKK